MGGITRKNVLGFTLNGFSLRDDYYNGITIHKQNKLAFTLNGFEFNEVDEYIYDYIFYVTPLKMNTVQYSEDPYANFEFPFTADKELEISAFVNEVLLPCNEPITYTVTNELETLYPVGVNYI